MNLSPIYSSMGPMSHDGDSPGQFIEWLSKRTEMYALPFEGRYFDVGTPETLEAARAAY